MFDLIQVRRTGTEENGEIITVSRKYFENVLRLKPEFEELGGLNGDVAVAAARMLAALPDANLNAASIIQPTITIGEMPRTRAGKVKPNG